MTIEFSAKEFDERCRVQFGLRYKAFNLSLKFEFGAKIQILAPKFEIGAKKCVRGESLFRDLEEARKFASPDRQLLKEDVREEEVLISYKQIVKTHDEMSAHLSFCLSDYLLFQHLPAFLSARHISCLPVTCLVYLSHISCLPVTYLVCLNSKCGLSANL